MEQNTNWGTPAEPKKPNQTQSESTSSGPVPSSSNHNSPQSWGQLQSGYHMGFSTLMKINVFICAFVIPAVVLMSFSEVLGLEEDSGAAATFLYAIVAFTIWVMMSYKVKLFDNIARIARNTEMIIHAVEHSKEETGGTDK